LTTTLRTSSSPDTQKTIRQEKNAKCKNIRDELLAEMIPESQQLIKGAMEKNSKRGIFLAVSLANQSDWIRTE